MILLAKTTGDGTDALVARAETLNPYDVPCIEVFEAETVLPSFAEWRVGSVGGSDDEQARQAATVERSSV